MRDILARSSTFRVWVAEKRTVCRFSVRGKRKEGKKEEWVRRKRREGKKEEWVEEKKEEGGEDSWC